MSDDIRAGQEETAEWIAAAPAAGDRFPLSRLPAGYETYTKVFHPIYRDPSIDDRESRWTDTPNPFVSELLARANPALRIEDSFLQWQEVPEDWPRVRWGELLAPAGKALSPDLGFSELQELTGLKPWPRALLPPLEGSLIVPMAKALAEALAPLTPVELGFSGVLGSNPRPGKLGSVGRNNRLSRVCLACRSCLALAHRPRRLLHGCRWRRASRRDARFLSRVGVLAVMSDHLGHRRRTRIPCYDRRMAERITLSIDPELAAGIREAAESEGMSVSGWVARSALQSLKNQRLLSIISEYEREHGEITDDELQRAERAWQASR